MRGTCQLRLSGVEGKAPQYLCVSSLLRINELPAMIVSTNFCDLLHPDPFCIQLDLRAVACLEYPSSTSCFLFSKVNGRGVTVPSPLLTLFSHSSDYRFTSPQLFCYLAFECRKSLHSCHVPSVSVFRTIDIEKKVYLF